LRTGNGLLQPTQNFGQPDECDAKCLVMSQPRSDHQRERADQKSDAQHGRDVDLAGVEVTEPELSVYLPHVFLLLCGSIILRFDGPDCEQVHAIA
jgi:hypothetical protein